MAVQCEIRGDDESAQRLRRQMSKPWLVKFPQIAVYGQRQGLSLSLSQDLVAVAKTGSGKTCGFLLPALARIAERGPVGWPIIIIIINIVITTSTIIIIINVIAIDDYNRDNIYIYICIYIYIYRCIHKCISLSMYIYIYIYI